MNVSGGDVTADKIDNSGTLTNSSNVTASTSLDNSGTVENAGQIKSDIVDNSGTLTNQADGKIETGAVNNSNTLNNAGDFTAKGKVTNSGTINNTDGNFNANSGVDSTQGTINVDGGTMAVNGDSELGNVTNGDGTNGGVLNIGSTTSHANQITSGDTAASQASGTNTGLSRTAINGGSLTVSQDSKLGNVDVGSRGTTFKMGNGSPKLDMATLNTAGQTNITTDNGKDKGQIAVGTITGNGNVNLALSQKASNQLKGNSSWTIAQDAADVIDVVKDNLSDPNAKGFNVRVAEGDVTGELTAKTDANGNVVDVQEKKNPTVGDLENLVNNNFLMFREQMNDVSKRMGDLRTMPNSDGAWARTSAGHAQYSSMNTSYQTLQVGADHRIGDFYIGGTASYTDGDTSLKRGSADEKNYTFGVYGGWIGQDGQYVDVILKHHHLESDYDLRNARGEKVKGSFDNNGYSASIEYGRRFGIANTSFYVEPQVEFMLGRLDSAIYKTNNGIKVKQDRINSTIGRLGVAAG